MDGFQAEEKLNRAGPKNVRKILDVILYAFKAESCTAENFYNTLKKLIKLLPPGIIKSLTGDRGRVCLVSEN